MFDLLGGEITALDTATALSAAAELRATSDHAERRLLQVAVQLADLNPLPKTARGDDRWLPGMEQARVYGGDGCPKVAEFATIELGAVLGTSSGAAASLIGDALALRHRLPRLWRRVVAGEVQAWRARQVAHACWQLSREAAALVDERVADSVQELTPYRLGKIVQAAVMEADPERAKEEAEEAARKRGVWVGQSNAYGTKSIVAKAAAADAIRFDARVDQIADALAELGDTDPKDLRRARAIGWLANPQATLDLIHHTTPSPPTATDPTRDEPTDEPTDEEASAAFNAKDTDADGTSAVCEDDATNERSATTERSATNQPGATSQPSEDGATTGDRTTAQDPTTAQAPTTSRDRTVGERDESSDLGADATDARATEARPTAGPATDGPTTAPVRAGRTLTDGPTTDGRGTATDRGGTDDRAAAGYGVGVGDQSGDRRRGGLKRDERYSPTLYVHLSAETLAARSGLLRVGDTRATEKVGGVGPLLASQLADLLGDPRMIGKIVVKPVIDLADRISVDAYEIPKRIRERVLLRYLTCMFPYCNRPATPSIDLDHVVPFDDTGPPGQTSNENLGPGCRLHHRVKTHGGWDVQRDADGAFEWTSPHGYRFLVDHTGTHSLDGATAHYVDRTATHGPDHADSQPIDRTGTDRVTHAGAHPAECVEIDCADHGGTDPLERVETDRVTDAGALPIEHVGTDRVDHTGTHRAERFGPIAAITRTRTKSTSVRTVRTGAIAATHSLQPVDTDRVKRAATHRPECSGAPNPAERVGTDRHDPTHART